MRRFYASATALLVVLGTGLGCAMDKDGGVSSKWTNDEDKGKTELPTDAPQPRIAPGTHMAAGKMLEQQGDLVRAIEQYQKALAADPTLTAAYNRLGVAHQRLGHLDEAEAFFTRGIEANPKSSMLQNNLGFFYLQQQRYAKAERAFRSALSIAPEFARARMNLGITLARTYRFGDSVTEFSRVVPKEAAFCNVAAICEDMSDYRQAEQALHKALDANPEYAPAQEHLGRIAGLARAAPPKSDQPLRDEAPTTAVVEGDTAEAVISAPLAGAGDEEAADIP